VTVTYRYNNGSGKSESKQVTVGTAAGSAPAPTRSGYRLTGWNTEPKGSGTAFTPSTVVTADTVVFAQWAPVSYGDYYDDDDDDDDDKYTPDYESSGGNTPPANDDSGGGSRVGAPAQSYSSPGDQGFINEAESQAGQQEQSGDPPREPDAENSIGDSRVPLSALPGIERYGSWGLLNLILSALGVILAALRVWRFTTKRQIRQERLEDEKRRKRHRLQWCAAAAILGIAGAIVFLITQDLTQQMVWIGRWFTVTAIIFAAELVAVWYELRLGKDGEEEPEISS
jgi:hypothetical protein